MNGKTILEQLKNCRQSDLGEFLISEDLICAIVTLLEELPDVVVDE